MPRTPTAPTWSPGARRESSTTYAPVSASPTGSPRCFPTAASLFTAHVDMGLRPTDTGTGLDVHWRITDSTVDSVDFIAGSEIGFGQSLDKLAATLAADSHDTDSTDTSSTK
jgi:hypothetical protein